MIKEQFLKVRKFTRKIYLSRGLNIKSFNKIRLTVDILISSSEQLFLITLLNLHNHFDYFRFKSHGEYANEIYENDD